MSLSTSIKRAVGKTPYPFQELVVDWLLDGHRVVLRAPTGAGKTLVAVAPFLLQAQPAPAQLIYSLPLRTLARSLRDTVRELPAARGGGRRVLLQTGQDPGDPHFLGDLVFTTIDQTLSSFLNMPFSVGYGQSNINAAAVRSAYLVFDEAHLLDRDRAFQTMIHLLGTRRADLPCLIMSATLSDCMLRGLAERLDAKWYSVSEGELRTIPSQSVRRRNLRLVDHHLDAASVLALHRHKTLVVCNTVRQAQALFRDLCELRQRHGRPKPVLLHSRFLRQDRTTNETELIRLFGRGQIACGDAIGIATQVIEVGLDISAEVMHIVCAPIDALVQRWGRCARFEGEAGTVVVYPPPTDSARPWAPYDEQLSVATLGALQDALAAGNIDLSFAEELRLINLVLEGRDEETLARCDAGSYDLGRRVKRVLWGDKEGAAAELIRSVDNVNAIIHGCPAELASPFAVEAFSLPRNSVKGGIAAALRQTPDQPVAWALAWRSGEAQDRDSAQGQTDYQWEPIVAAGQASASPLVALSPLAASYDPDVGLLFEPGGDWQSPSRLSASERKLYTYELESYEAHIERALAAFELLGRRLTATVPSLEAAFGLPTGVAMQLARASIAAHDFGKLTVEWQAWAHAWQAAIDEPQEEAMFVAHTHSSPRVSPPNERPLPKRGPHAGAGARLTALALGPWLSSLGLKERIARGLLSCALSAIARHHSPYTVAHQAFGVQPSAARLMEDTLMKLGIPAPSNLAKTYEQGSLESWIIEHREPDDDRWFDFYCWLVRCVRLADQYSLNPALLTRGPEADA